MELRALQLRESADVARLQCEVQSVTGTATLWFEVPRRYAAALATDRYDGLLIAVLLHAMVHGEDVVVRGALSERLLFNLNHFYVSLMSELSRDFRRVRITADSLVGGMAQHRPIAAATGFSAGVDSFAAIHDHFVAESRPGYRLTHLLFNNVGSHGHRDAAAARALFRQRFESVRGYPEGVGLELIPVDSNLHEILKLDFELTHTPRNLAVPLLLQPLLGRFYYASTYRYRDCFVGEHFDSGCMDPMAVPLLSTDTLDCVATGSQYTRVEKTRLNGLVPGANRWLNVCTNPAAAGRNCSYCLKCCRTLMTLEVLGMLDDYRGVFDLDVWARARNRFVSERFLNNRQPQNRRRLTVELHEYLNEIGYRFTLAQRAGSLLNFLPRKVRKLGRSVRRRLRGGH